MVAPLRESDLDLNSLRRRWPPRTDITLAEFKANAVDRSTPDVKHCFTRRSGRVDVKFALS
jgi:hypothetical protein